MKQVPVKDTNGVTRYRLVPETEAERRELQRRAHGVKSGGIDARDEDDPKDEWSDE